MAVDDFAKFESHWQRRKSSGLERARIATASEELAISLAWLRDVGPGVDDHLKGPGILTQLGRSCSANEIGTEYLRLIFRYTQNRRLKGQFADDVSEQCVFVAIIHDGEEWQFGTLLVHVLRNPLTRSGTIADWCVLPSARLIVRLS